MSASQYDESIEAELLASLLGSSEAVSDARHVVTSDDFYVPGHRLIWQALGDAHDRGQRPTLDSVRAVMIESGTLEAAGGATKLVQIAQSSHSSRWQPIADAVVTLARRRMMTVVMRDALQRLNGGEANVYELATEVADSLDEVRPLGQLPRSLSTIADFVSGGSSTAVQRSQWVIPGLMRAGWRTMIVASEGAGKSILSRQIAVATSQGIHPLHFGAIEPQTTLLIDLENPADVLLDWCTSLDELSHTTRHEYDATRAWLWHEPGGINLLKPHDRGRLVRVLDHVRPKLVLIGPVYKCYRVGRSDEESTAELQALFDDLRTRFGFALILEHHAPKGESGRRELVPYGSSLWLRWPEFGVKLVPGDAAGVFKVKRFRGDRAQAAWPIELRYASKWPWEGVWPDGTFSNEPTSDF